MTGAPFPLQDLAPAVRFGWSGRIVLLLLIAGVPLLASLQPHQTDGETPLPPRVPLYASAAVVIWVLAALAGLALMVESLPLARIGLHAAPLRRILAWAAGVSVATLLVSYVITRVGAALGARESRLALHLIPGDVRERAAFLGLSATAGFCEELVYHGYVLAGLAAWLGSGWWAAVIANVAFGILHGYQNAIGMVRAGVMGFLLCLPVVAGVGLWPAMLAHFAVNAILGLGGWRWFLPESAAR